MVKVIPVVSESCVLRFPDKNLGSKDCIVKPLGSLSPQMGDHTYRTSSSHAQPLARFPDVVMFSVVLAGVV